MNLVQQIESDLAFTLEDTDTGFGVVVQFKDEKRQWVDIVCQSTDIAYFMDLNTGVAVNARTIEIVARQKTLSEAHVSLDADSLAQYTSTLGDSYTLKVQRKDPDRKMGIVKLTLEVVKHG